MVTVTPDLTLVPHKPYVTGFYKYVYPEITYT